MDFPGLKPHKVAAHDLAIRNLLLPQIRVFIIGRRRLGIVSRRLGPHDSMIRLGYYLLYIYTVYT